MLTIRNIEEAANRVRNCVRQTPIVPTFYPKEGKDPIYLKLENMQRTGSFKERGAANKCLLLREREKGRSLIAASAGNHAQAVALHGTKLGFDVTIYMPQQTALTKVLSTQGWGAKVCLEGHGFDEATELAIKRAKAEGVPFVHAFDDPEIIAGQGTLGLEILREMEDLERIIIPIGGGGLCAGTAMALKDRNSEIEVLGVQAEAYPYTFRAMKNILDLSREKHTPPTIADGISMKSIGHHTLPIIRKYVDDVMTVSEQEMANAVLYLLETSKILVEGAGAAGMAAIMAGKIPMDGKKTVAVISGGNIDVNVISRIIEKGLVKTGRLLRLNVIIPDQPGGLQGLTTLLARVRANILQIHHERASDHVSLYDTGTELTLETRGEEHKKDVIRTLREHGYEVSTL